jgi:nitroimidazol reductase NimA-like FMN-containing flavoprotein (pyridoxamine 5'-phosphate oxidase superfamily)
MITDRKVIDDIINRCEACYVAMVDPEQKPYVLPFNFGYQDQIIYLHSAREGKKMDILHKNGQVCIAFSTDHVLRHSHDNVACSYGMKYRSVVANGHVEFIDDFDEKQRILNIVMKKYTGREFTFNAPAIHEVEVYRVVIESITGRESGY